jgi:hypothetical protein
MASGRQQRERWRSTVSKKGATLRARPWSSFSNISERRAPTITGRCAGSTSGPSAPTGYANPSGPRTRPADLFTYEAARDALREIVDKVWGYCERSGIRGRTVTLKVKFGNFQIITRSRTGQMQIRTRGELEQLGDGLLAPLFPVARGIRLLGISMSSLAAEQAEQPEFGLPV